MCPNSEPFLASLVCTATCVYLQHNSYKVPGTIQGTIYQHWNSFNSIRLLHTTKPYSLVKQESKHIPNVCAGNMITKHLKQHPNKTIATVRMRRDVTMTTFVVNA